MSTSKGKIALKKLKELDTIWHSDSTLVFKSSQDKVVTGRWLNNEFIQLDNEAVELCKKFGFKYDQVLYESLQENEMEEFSRWLLF